MALLAALPVINLAGWVDETMRHSRYLYMPGLFMIAAAAGSISRARWGNAALAAVVAANATGAAHNVGAYRDMVRIAQATARQVSLDCDQYGAAVVDLTGIDPGAAGVLFFRSEIVARLHDAKPDVCIRLTAEACESSGQVLRYQWSSASQKLNRIGALNPSGTPSGSSKR